MSELSQFPRSSAPQSLSPRSSLLRLLLIKRRLQQHCITEINLNCVCAICCSVLAVVRSPPCSICHSFGVEDKHTDENDSDHRTISVWICLLLPDSISAYFALSLALFCSLFLSLGGRGYKSSKQTFPLHCICTYLLHLNMFAQHMDQISNSSYIYTIEFYFV